MRITTPGLSGRSETHHIALTLDDGPDATATPVILDTLARFDVRATFFVIGEHLHANAALIRRMHDDGHELAVHGYTHRLVLRLRPADLTADITRTASLLTELTGIPPRWYRPPFGVTSLACRDAAHAANLRPMLWTAWGRDWSRWVTPAGIVRRVLRTIRPGGVVLLHDSDRYSAPGSWRNTAAALVPLLERWKAADIPVGPLRDHYPPHDTSAPSLNEGGGGRNTSAVHPAAYMFMVRSAHAARRMIPARR